MASICPSSGRKKNWMPRLACSLVRVVGEVGLSAIVPTAVEVNRRLGLSTCTVEEMGSSDDGRRGVTKYS